MFLFWVFLAVCVFVPALSALHFGAHRGAARMYAALIAAFLGLVVMLVWISVQAFGIDVSAIRTHVFGDETGFWTDLDRLQARETGQAVMLLGVVCVSVLVAGGVSFVSVGVVAAIAWCCDADRRDRSARAAPGAQQTGRVGDG